MATEHTDQLTGWLDGYTGRRASHTAGQIVPVPLQNDHTRHLHTHNTDSTHIHSFAALHRPPQHCIHSSLSPVIIPQPGRLADIHRPPQ